MITLWNEPKPGQIGKNNSKATNVGKFQISKNNFQTISKSQYPNHNIQTANKNTING